jgi:hypothetical protein
VDREKVPVGHHEALSYEGGSFGFYESVHSRAPARSWCKLRVCRDLKAVVDIDSAWSPRCSFDVDDLTIHIDQINPILDSYSADPTFSSHLDCGGLNPMLR